MGRCSNNILIGVAVAIALGVLLGCIMPAGFLLFVVCAVTIGVGVLILFVR
ncbi:MAG: hypothetical protein RSA70_04460 [Clostridia bacterium]